MGESKVVPWRVGGDVELGAEVELERDSRELARGPWAIGRGPRCLGPIEATAGAYVRCGGSTGLVELVAGRV
jgi:hypothetical protein